MSFCGNEIPTKWRGNEIPTNRAWELYTYNPAARILLYELDKLSELIGVYELDRLW